jgi:ATP-binding cassette subfamily B protein
MSGAPDLAGLVWPAEGLTAALDAAAAATGLPAGARGGQGGDGKRPAAAGRSAGGEGVEVLPVEVRWRELGDTLPGLGPAVLRLRDPGGGHLVLLGRRGRRLAMLAPDGRRRRLGARRLAAALVERAGAPHAAGVDALPNGLALGRRRRRARRALVAAAAAAGAGLEAHLLAPAGERPAAAELRDGRLWRPAAALLAAMAGWQALALGSWYLLGRGALARDAGGGWLVAWALLLPTLALVEGAELGAAAVFGQRAAVWMRRRLFSALLAPAADRLRGEGTGRLLGRILAAETLERVALASLPARLLAATELGGALAALGHGAAARQLVVLLALAGGSAAALAAGHRRAHGAGAEARRELTGELVEAVAGHRSRLAEGAGRADPEEDARLAGCHALTRALGRWETGLRVALPRVWMVTGLATLAVAGGGAEGPGRVATALGGLWLGRAGLARLAAALCEASSARSAVREVRPIVEALGAGGCCGGEGGGEHVGEHGGSAGACGAAVVPHGALLLEARGLGCRTPDGKRQLVSDAGLAIRRGDRLVLDGPSGAGKSSLAAVLAGQRRADGGLLLLGGLDVATLGGEAWRRRVVAVPQLHANHIFAETLAFNLLLGRGWPAPAGDLAAADEVCRELGLGELLDRLPSGLEQRVGEAGWELSDGEASRVCLARALLQEPDLLILDESLAALDPESRLEVLAAVERRARTLVVIAHAAGG